MPLQDHIATLEPGDFWVVVGLLALFAAISFLFTFRSVSRARLIENTPTSKIRSAAQGFVELEGIVQPAATGPIEAPLTGTPCCWFSYQIERRHDKGWDTVEEGRSDEPFVLADDSGTCLVCPREAEIHSDRKHTWQGNERHPRQLTADGFNLARLLTGSPTYRYTETYLCADMPLYALGLFQSRDELEVREEVQTERRTLLHQWKKDPSGLLARFDRNGNGQIDPEEWEQARLSAQRQATLIQQGKVAHAPPHRLIKPKGHPFLLSTQPQWELARRQRYRALGSLLAFFVIGGLLVMILNLR